MKPIYTLTLLAALLLVLGCDPATPPEESPDAPAPRTVAVHLFEWRWDDIAQECESFLGPMGYQAVQVSPPTEHALVTDPAGPWWDRYQPASYTINTRSGDRAAFADMVQRCNDAGVEIWVDAVINHTTGADRTETIAGQQIGSYDFPGLYSYDDFHHCGLTDGDDIQDWNDPTQVQTCELVNLSDLATGKENVRDTLAAYLSDLASLGVSGIRIDAARHMSADDIRAILDRVDGDLYVYQEVIDPNPPTWARDYYQNGDVTEFQYSSTISDVFYNGPLARLHGQGSVWETVPFLPSDSAFVFVDNHDNQRGHGGGGHIVMHGEGQLHNLAMAFMLAYPYGQARVMSSYRFETDWQGPPRTEDGATKRVHGPDGLNCGQGEWVCEHRNPMVAGLVGFRNSTDGVPLSSWWDDGANQIAFAREGAGFFALNRSDTVMEQTLPTTLPAGSYCDVADGALTANGCAGASVTVDADGRATVTVPPMDAVAIHTAARAD